MTFPSLGDNFRFTNSSIVIRIESVKPCGVHIRQEKDYYSEFKIAIVFRRNCFARAEIDYVYGRKEKEMNDNRAWMLGHEKIGKLLWKLSVPSIIGLMVQATYNMVDTIFVGRVVGVNAIGGLTVALPLQILVMALIQTIAVGTSSIISRSLGSEEHDKANRTLGNATFISVCLGILVTGLGLLFLENLISLFGGTEAILPYARDYLSIILIGGVFVSYASVMNEVARAEGNAKISMLTMIISAVANIILDAVFILGLDWGVKGAAFATVIAQAIAAVWLLLYFLRGKSLLKYEKKYLKPDTKITRETLAVGSSAFIRHGAGSITMIILTRSLVHYGGELAIAVFGVVNKVLIFVFQPMMGIMMGLQPIIGFNYGAHKIERVKSAVKSALIYNVGFSLFMTVIVLSMPQTVISIFSGDVSLLGMGRGAIQIITFVLPLVAFQLISIGMFQSLGKSSEAFILAISRQVLFLIPIMLLLPMILGLNGLWYTFPITDIFSAALTILLFYRQWKIFRRDGLEEQKTEETKLVVDTKILNPKLDD
jgi:putative MATE family efflux protein